MVKVVDVNKFTINLFKAKSKGDFIDGLEKIFTESSYEKFKDEIIAMSEGKTSYESEDIVKTLTGDKIHISLKWILTPGNEKTYSKRLVSIIDITESKRAEKELNQRAKLAMLGAEVWHRAHPGRDPSSNPAKVHRSISQISRCRFSTYLDAQ